MTDLNFYKLNNGLKLKDIIDYIKNDLDISVEVDNYNPDLIISQIATLEQASRNDISFLFNVKYLKALNQTNASACIVPLNFKSDNLKSISFLKVKNPYLIQAHLIDLFYSAKQTSIAKIASNAQISKLAQIGKNCQIGPFCVIEDNAEIGDKSCINAGSYIGYGVKIGKNCQIGQNVTITYSYLGDNVNIHAGARIGQDGFRFATENGKHKKIFHFGRVIIGNDVRIGANTTIDRGSIEDTIIEDNCYIDNLVQIAHNVQIGYGSIIVAQVGIAGSTKIGRHCALGGQVGIAGHLTIGDRAQISGQSGVMQDVPSEQIMGGSPAVPVKTWHKQTIILKKLANEYNKNN